MLKKGMQKTWTIVQNGAKMGAGIEKKFIKKRSKIDAKKGPHARTRPEGRQVGRAPLIKTKSPFLVSFSPRPRFVLI